MCGIEKKARRQAAALLLGIEQVQDGISRQGQRRRAKVLTLARVGRELGEQAQHAYFGAVRRALGRRPRRP